MSNIRTFHKNSKEGRTPQKDAIRRELAQYTHKFFLENTEYKGIRLLTLPGAWYAFETNIRTRFKKKGVRTMIPYFTCCERDQKIFNLVAATVKGRLTRPVRYYHSNGLGVEMVSNHQDTRVIKMDIFEFMEKSEGREEENGYHCIWLDTQSPITAIDQKIRFLPNVTKAGPSLFAITVLKARESRNVGDRIEYITKLVEQTGLGYKLAKYWDYGDSSPMLQILFEKYE